MNWHALIGVVTFSLLAIALTVCIQKSRQHARYIASVATDQLNTRSARSAHAVRRQFNDLPVPKLKKADNHSHGRLAAARSAAAALAERLAAGLGLEGYFVQCSRADLRLQRPGSREYFWPKDVQVPPASYAPGINDILVLIDVDFYLDMAGWLLNNTLRPIMIYTFCPEAAASTSDEMSFTFDSAGNVVMKVRGCAKYDHPLWDYNEDNLCITNFSWWRFFLLPWTLRTQTYLVDRKRMDAHRTLVLLTPTGSWYWWSALCVKIFATVTPLRRLDVIDGDHIRIDVFTATGHMRSTGRVGEYHCATISVATDTMLAASARTGKNPLSAPTIMRLLNDVRGEQQNAVVALLEYQRLKAGKIPVVVYTGVDSVRTYQFTPANFDPEEKSSLDPYMACLIEGAYVPDQGRSNERQAVVGRVEKLQRAIKCDPNHFMYMIIDEFVKFLFPVAGVLHPTEIDVVYEKQHRPPQRVILDEAATGGVDVASASTFMKKESYNEPKDPRVISTLPGCTKMMFSCFMYALAEHCKQFVWYAFGMTPKEIAERVSDICQGASMVVLTDFSRFDGRISTFIRYLEKRICARGFALAHLDELTILQDKHIGVKARTRTGYLYNSGTSRLSGSPATSVMNTLVNLFQAYLALRSTYIDGAFLSPSEAWRSLGIYGGDDGLTPNVNPEMYAKRAADSGMKLTSTVVQRGNMGVEFLSRIFGPDVWFGDPNSMCDVMRQLLKLHLSVCLPPNVTPLDKLIEKARGYAQSDAFTPIIGEYVIRVLQLTAGAKKMEDNTSRALKGWFAYAYPDVIGEACVQFPNYKTDWMTEKIMTQMPGFDFALFEYYLKECDSVEKLLKFPVLWTAPETRHADQAVVVNDTLLTPQTEVPTCEWHPHSKTHTTANCRSRKAPKVRRGGGGSGNPNPINAAHPRTSPTARAGGNQHPRPSPKARAGGNRQAARTSARRGAATTNSRTFKRAATGKGKARASRAAPRPSR